jgi:SAM-dependent methyltransferase
LNFPASVKELPRPETLSDVFDPPVTSEEEVPDYMEEVYDWAYVNPRNVALLDRPIVVDVLLFGNARRLMRSALNEITPGQRVYMVAHVYGNFVKRLADRIGAGGRFSIIDVTPIQVANCRRKIGDLPHVSVEQADAATHIGAPVDTALSFFLLHEVPENKKRGIVNSMLAQVAPGGKAVFVDYHRPSLWQPIRYILEFVNYKLEPFARALWTREIKEYASDADDFIWEKKTFFGGVYQKVIARRRT